VGPHDFRSPSYREFVAKLREPETAGRTALREVVAGDAVAGWEVRFPPAGTRFARADDNALVLARNSVGTQVLLLSDLGSEGQGALLAAEGDLGAEVVVAGLPVDAEPLMPRLLDRVVPRQVVLTDAAWPAAQHAGAELRGRLAATGATILATSEAGTVTLILEDGDCEVRLMPGR